MSSLFGHSFSTSALQKKPVNDDPDILKLLAGASSLSLQAEKKDHEKFQQDLNSASAQGNKLRAVANTAPASFFTQKQASQTAKPNLQVVGGSSLFAQQQQQRAVVIGASAKTQNNRASEKTEHITPRM